MGGLTFINLGFLSLAAIAPIIAFAYLKKTERKRQVVSSLIFFRHLRRKPLRRRRIELPLRFFIELLGLLLLSVAAAQPLLKSNSEDVAIIIDNSMSMLATTPEGTETRFAAAITAAKTFLDSSKAQRFALYSAAPTLRRLDPPWLSSSEIESKLSEVHVSLSSESLPIAIQQIAETGEFDRVAVFSDKNADLSPTQFASTLRSVKQTKVEGHSVGNPAPNIYLAHLREEVSALHETERKIVAAVGYSGTGEAKIVVELYVVNPASVSQTSTAPLTSLNIAVSSGRLSEATFKLPLGKNESSLFKFRVRLQSNTGNLDSIADDNSGYLSLSGRGAGSSLLVTPITADDSKFGLAALKNLSFDVKTPEQFALLTPEQVSRYQLLFFHRSAPANPPRVPSIYCLPPAGNTIFPVNQEVTNPIVSSWDSAHPLTTYLDFPLLRFSNAVTLSTPPWAQRVVNLEQGPVLVAGESQGVRLAGIGAELLPFEGAKTPSVTVLTLNLINWISGGSELSDTTLTGATISTDAPKVLSLTGPNGLAMELPKSGSEKQSIALDQPGFYNLTSIAANNDRVSSQRFLAVNSFYPEESSTYETGSYSVAEQFSTEVAPTEQAQPIWPYLLIAALVLLLMELGYQLTQRGEDAVVA